VAPTKILDISGRWQTNLPPLVYDFEQNANQITWSIPSLERGPAEIKGRDIFATIGQRKVHFVIETIDRNGRPIKITSSDPEYVDLIIYR